MNSTQKDVEIISGNNVFLQSSKNKDYKWPLSSSKNVNLLFGSAYTIKGGWDGISCIYTVRGREFEDLSFASGTTLREIYNYDDSLGHKLREYEDGKKFLFTYEDIPTFDFGDREWDSIKNIVIYFDDEHESFTLIHCSHGYKIPQIEIYLDLDLKSADPEFFDLLKLVK